MSRKHFSRYNDNFEPCDTGRQFFEKCDQFNLNDLNILLSSVDTVRQLYKLQLDTDFVESLGEALEGQLSGYAVYPFAGHDWMLKRGGKSGYQYMLQNASEGLIILIKSRYAKLDCSGTHLKIEVSPKTIFDMGPDQLQLLMDNFAELVSLDGHYQPEGVAVHMALDFQGWQPPIDFINKLTCRSRRVTDHNGITQLYLDHDVCSVYGKGQSYLFGSANTTQIAIYNKSLEAKASDKLDFFLDRWNTKRADFDSPLYNPEIPVWRIEIRFHHSVIKQFADMNTKTPINCVDEKGRILKGGEMHTCRLATFESLIPHLGGLWEYGLNNFRYDYNSRLIHPVWTVFMTDSDFDQYETGFVYRRKYKTPGVGNEKNVMIATGNLLSIYVRNGFRTKEAIKFLKKSGIWRDLTKYFSDRGSNKSDLYRWIDDGMIKRRLSSKFAA